MELETRVALLESEAKQRHAELMELRDAVKDLTDAVRQINQWQAKVDLPIRGAGFFFVGLLTAAGYGMWSFLKALSS